MKRSIVLALFAGTLAACGPSVPTPPGTAAPAPVPAAPKVLFEKYITVAQRGTQNFDFECDGNTSLVVELVPDGTMYFTLTEPNGMPLLNDLKINNNVPKWTQEVKAATKGKYGVKVQNMNLTTSKSVRVKIETK